MKHLLIAFAVVSGVSSVCPASDEINTKTVTVDVFMQGNVLGGINVPVIVPSEFEPAILPKANLGYSYWMRPEDVTHANASGQLPGQHGYMYGKLSPNVGYDARRDLFVGLEDPEALAKAKAQMPSLAIERYRFGAHPIVLFSFTSEDRKKFAYAMYVATNIDTNVVYIALRPPGNSQEVGEQIWNRLKASLVKVKMQ
jgi:hypothetical protein